jgi:hypothetical protein
VKNPQIRIPFYIVISLILAGLLTSIQAGTLVRADVGVRPVLPGGSSIQPGEETPIEMAIEVVTMNVREATAEDNASVKLNPDAYGFELHPIWYEAAADVQADFTMRNPTVEDISLTAWFPLASSLGNAEWNFNPEEFVPRINNFEITSGGTPVQFKVSDMPNPAGTDKPALPWASFPLTFPAGKDTDIRVQYTVPLSPSAKGHEVALYYVFQTGAGWAGPIGQADLIVDLPYPASAETIADNSKITLPYGGIGAISSGLPVGAKIKGNQARWSWRNFEPTPQDDFAIWLLKPQVWRDLQAARDAVKTNPGDGNAWLDLAIIYHSLSASPMSSAAQLFSPFYLPQAVEAYQKAEKLLPDHPAPHVGLGLLAIVRKAGSTSAVSPASLQRAQGELHVAQTLEAKNPTLAGEEVYSNQILGDAISMFGYNDATATADAVNLQVQFISMTARATIDYQTIEAWKISKGDIMACWPTAAQECTAQAIRSETVQPSRTGTPPMNLTPTPVTSNGRIPVITITLGEFVILGFLVALLLIYLIYRKEIKQK